MEERYANEFSTFGLTLGNLDGHTAALGSCRNAVSCGHRRSGRTPRRFRFFGTRQDTGRRPHGRHERCGLPAARHERSNHCRTADAAANPGSHCDGYPAGDEYFYTRRYTHCHVYYQAQFNPYVNTHGAADRRPHPAADVHARRTCVYDGSDALRGRPA